MSSLWNGTSELHDVSGDKGVLFGASWNLQSLGRNGSVNLNSLTAVSLCSRMHCSLYKLPTLGQKGIIFNLCSGFLTGVWASSPWLGLPASLSICRKFKKKKTQPPIIRSCHCSWVKPGCYRETADRNHIFWKSQIIAGIVKSTQQKAQHSQWTKASQNMSSVSLSSSSARVTLRVFFFMVLPVLLFPSVPLGVMINFVFCLNCHIHSN